jgi:hypothetical protein
MIFVCIAVLEGCAAEAVDSDGDVPLDTSEGALFGNVTTTDCTTAERTFATNVVDIGRFVAVSPGFRECVNATMRSFQLIRNQGQLDGAGPYVPCSVDPFRSSSLDIQIQQAIFAAGSTNDVAITCTNQEGPIASAPRGTYNLQTAEQIFGHQLWREIAAWDNGQNADKSDHFQESRQLGADVLWHEGMHQWGYTHAPRDASVENKCPGQSESQSIPQIVGRCMETIMHKTWLRTCAGAPVVCTPTTSQRRIVMRYTSDRCDCVTDPEEDVGVILDAGQTCPTEELRITMDDEDDDNENARSGWIGKTVSSSNTTFSFCRTPGGRFRPIPSSSSSANYAVLRMGKTCPAGSVPFSRFFDNEDEGNINSFAGHVSPSRSDGNTRLEFCMFRASASAAAFTFPSLSGGVPYGVLAGSSFPAALATGWIKTDDEDDNNANRLEGNISGTSSFLSADSNTVLRLARVR